MSRILILSLLLCGTARSFAQVDESATGAWYMYFYNWTFEDSQWGLQGDFQYRDWELAGDMEQLLLRSGLTWSPEGSDLLLTLGYANITSGAPGANSATTSENRIYQELLYPMKLGSRFYFTHRLRTEQRFVEGQDFRTRVRYNLFLNVPLNKPTLEPDAVYLALYNELFLNGQNDIGNGRSVDTFDRNRTYMGIGHVVSSGLRIQLGWMYQTTEFWSKGQLQLSAHHRF